MNAGLCLGFTTTWIRPAAKLIDLLRKPFLARHVLRQQVGCVCRLLEYLLVHVVVSCRNWILEMNIQKALYVLGRRRYQSDRY